MNKEKEALEIAAGFWQSLIRQSDTAGLDNRTTPNFELRDLVTGDVLSMDRLQSASSTAGARQPGSVTIEEQFVAKEDRIVTRFTVSGAGSSVVAIGTSRLHDDKVAEASILWNRTAASGGTQALRASSGDESPEEPVWRWPPWDWGSSA